jgi:hypothetical protein
MHWGISHLNIGLFKQTGRMGAFWIFKSSYFNLGCAPKKSQKTAENCRKPHEKAHAADFT